MYTVRSTVSRLDASGMQRVAKKALPKVFLGNNLYASTRPFGMTPKQLDKFYDDIVERMGLGMIEIYKNGKEKLAPTQLEAERKAYLKSVKQAEKGISERQAKKEAARKKATEKAEREAAKKAKAEAQSKAAAEEAEAKKKAEEAAAAEEAKKKAEVEKKPDGNKPDSE